jgi:hypothetical protein
MQVRGGFWERRRGAARGGEGGGPPRGAARRARAPRRGAGVNTAARGFRSNAPALGLPARPRPRPHRPASAQEQAERATSVIQCNEALREVTLYQSAGGKSLSRTFRYDKACGAGGRAGGRRGAGKAAPWA